MSDAAEIARLRARCGELDAELAAMKRGVITGPMAEPVTSPASADLLFAAAEKTRMPMIVTDPHQPDNPIIFANRAFADLSGYTPEQLMGRNCRFLQGEGTDPQAVAKIREAVAERRDIAIDIVNYRGDGTPFVNELYISPVFARTGELLYFFGSQYDLTEQRRDHQLRVESEIRYKALFEAIDSGFCIIEMMFDAQGRPADYRFLEVNAAFEGQTGLRDAKGRTILQMAPTHETFWFQTYGEVARTRVAIRFENEAAALGRWFDVHAFPVDAPELNRVAVLFTDITERRRAEHELRALTETLEEQVEARTRELLGAEEALRQAQRMEAIGQLTGGVAHDFNNLLTIIRSAADFLQRDDISEARRKRYVEAVADTAERAAKLTGQLLAFARRQPLKAEVFDVGARVEAIADLVRTLVGEAVTVNARDCATPCLAEADPGQFETALVNLAVNARDAMDGQGEISIVSRRVDAIPAIRTHSARGGAFVAVSVTDRGKGIAPEAMDRIFEPFFTTKEVGKGTGLGLSQVFGFAKQSGGEVDVESAPGRTTFTLYLPAATAAARLPTPEPEPVAAARPDACILVVEDNDAVGRFTTDMLHDLGFRTLWAVDAQEALRMLADAPEAFDLVFSDVLMPGVNGVELGREVRRLYPDTPVLLTSGYSSVLAEEGTGGFELIRKPYSVEALSRVISRVLAG